MEKTIFRIECRTKGHGMWYNEKGELEPFIMNLTEGKSKHLSMEYDERYRKDGYEWFSGCQSVDLLRSWFSDKDVVELLENDYRLLYEIVSNHYIIEENQILFTKEGIVSQKEISFDELSV